MATDDGVQHPQVHANTVCCSPSSCNLESILLSSNSHSSMRSKKKVFFSTSTLPSNPIYEGPFPHRPPTAGLVSEVKRAYGEFIEYLIHPPRAEYRFDFFSFVLSSPPCLFCLPSCLLSIFLTMGGLYHSKIQPPPKHQPDRFGSSSIRYWRCSLRPRRHSSQQPSRERFGLFLLEAKRRRKERTKRDPL
jgi:hypothetical protein